MIEPPDPAVLHTTAALLHCLLADVAGTALPAAAHPVEPTIDGLRLGLLSDIESVLLAIERFVDRIVRIVAIARRIIGKIRWLFGA